jgi:hypothetical protein
MDGNGFLVLNGLFGWIAQEFVSKALQTEKLGVQLL